MTHIQMAGPDQSAVIGLVDAHGCQSYGLKDRGDARVLRLLSEIQDLQDELRHEHLRTTQDLRSENALLRQAACSCADSAEQASWGPVPSSGFDGCFSHPAGPRPTEVHGGELSSAWQEFAGLKSALQDVRLAGRAPEKLRLRASWPSVSDAMKHRVACCDQFVPEGPLPAVAAPCRPSRVFERASMHSASPPESGDECSSKFSSESPVADNRHTSCIHGSKKLEDGEEKKRVLKRVRERLFKAAPCNLKSKDNVTPAILHSALTSYGLAEYSLEQVDGLIKDICECQMLFPPGTDGGGHRTARAVRKRSSRVGPSLQRTGSDTLRGKLNAFMTRGVSRDVFSEELEGIPFEHFGDALFSTDLRRLLSTDSLIALDIVKEVLVCGNILKLVSDITRLTVLELASPQPEVSFLERIEPLVALLIISNGLLLGVQVDPSFENWGGWFFIESAFVMMFLCELCLRIFSLGMQRFFLGPDMSWNLMDFTIVCISLIETALSQWMWSTNMFRLIRLTRLSRLLRVMRFRMFKELVLMLRGLIGGFRTLGWAMVLLLSAVYVIALLMNSTLGQSDSVHMLLGEDADIYFSSVPGCMFLAFRCFIGDCSDSTGRSVLALLSSRYNIEFQIPFVMSTMLVNFGIFNLITALYIESTLEAAKQGASNPEQGRNQAVRVATIVKKLLQRMSFLYRLLQDVPSKPQSYMLSENGANESRTWRGSVINMNASAHDDCDADLEITKENFLAMMSDAVVQKHLDELDVPVNRMHLFDVLDADGSGSLIFSELVQGLLATRGEPKKSDTVACLLSVRNMQEMLTTHHSEFLKEVSVMKTQMRLMLGSDPLRDPRHARLSHVSMASLESCMECTPYADGCRSSRSNSRSLVQDQCTERVEGTTPTTEVPSAGDSAEHAAKAVLLGEGLISL